MKRLRKLAPFIALVCVFGLNSLAFGRAHPQGEEIPPGDLAVPSSYFRGGPGPDVDRITGSRIEHHVTDLGIVDLPIDVSSPSFGAWVSDGTGFTFYPGTGNPDGSFSIPGVSADTYILKFGAAYFVSSQRTVDLGEYVQGRTNAALARNGTILRARLTDMNPWNDDADDIEMVSSNAGAFVFGFSFLDVGGVRPAPGDTTLDVRLDYLVAGAPPRLIDASQGDQATIFQLVTQPGPAGTVYSGLAKAYSASDFTMIDGATTNLFASLHDVPVDQNWNRTIDFPSIHAFRTQAHPAAVFLGDEAFVDALPGGNGQGIYTGAYPDLVEMAADPEVTSTQLFMFNYGNPFPWQETFSTVLTFYGTRYQLPGTLFRTTIAGQIGTSDNSPCFPEPFAVQLSPPRNFRINGMPATDDLTGISVSPTLSWDAPAIGQASYHSLSVRELYVSGTFTRNRVIATLFTAGNELTIPPGILETGRTYAFRLFAESVPGANIEAAPFIDAFPHSWAPTFSGIEAP